MDNSINNKINLSKLKRQEIKTFKQELIGSIVFLISAYTILCVILPIILTK